MKKKRPFILLEVIIALALTMICATPLLTKPIRLLRSEIKQMELAEMERLANWSFAGIKADLLIHPDLSHLVHHAKLGGPIPLPPLSFALPGLTAKVVKRCYTLHCTETKETKEGKEYRLFAVDLFLTPVVKDAREKTRKYEYCVIVQRTKEAEFEITSANDF
ncbi:MAG: hypothetical protein KGI80_04950 [Verrucomicrobiota bacterium]|nr:hypothetical protein [Verrucomicrobiota bacterium]